MNENHPQSSTAKFPHNTWAKAAVLIVSVLLFLASTIYVFRSIRDLPGELIEKAGGGIKKAGQTLKDIAAAFNQGTILTSFTSYATSLNPTHNLQFATLRQNEIFTRTDEASTAFGYIPLPDVMIEARAPVEYTYFIDLNAKWELLLEDGVMYVLAPPIQFNEPAVNASEITYEIKKGSVFRNSNQAKENLKKSLMPMVQRRAKESIPLVRETGRKEIENFVERWLAKSFAGGKKYPVKIVLGDETSPPILKSAAKRSE